MSALRLAAALAALAAAAVALAWLLQRRLLYFPERYDLDRARAPAAARGLVPWPSSEAFAGWRAETEGARGTLLVFHGNAGSALDRGYFVDAFARARPELPLDVVLVEYPGYGPRSGAPSQPSILGAGLAALREARRAGPGPVIVAGESLGAAVAAHVAAAAPDEVAGLVLAVPLTSVPAVARRHYPLVPAWFHRDPWRADAALPRFGGPAAFLLAGRDEVTFPDLGRALFEAYPGPKRLWVDERAGHNGVAWDPGLPRWGEMVELAASGRRAPGR